MRITDEGLDLIIHYEGFHSKPYYDPIGIPTIGYGSIYDFDVNRVTMDTPEITEEEGRILLLQHLKRVVYPAIKRLVKVPLSEPSFSALCSFIYNVGSGNFQSSTMRMKLNRYDYYQAADEFPKWRRAGGKILKGLVRRRESERRMFISGIGQLE